MAISIRNPKVEELAREIGRIENRSMTEVIIDALEQKKEKIMNKNPAAELNLKKITEIADLCAALPVEDSRAADEILGYNEDGALD